MNAGFSKVWWLAAALLPYAAAQLAFLATIGRIPARLGLDAARAAEWRLYARRRAAGAFWGGVFWICAIAALAWPTDRRRTASGAVDAVLVAFVVDASNSMLAGETGQKPLDEALRFASRVADAAGASALSLVAFRGGAVTICPPTADRRAFEDALEWVGPGVTTASGSDYGAAIREATRPSLPAGSARIVIVLGDGNDTGGTARESAVAAADAGCAMAFVGFGPAAPKPVSSPGGAPIIDGEGRRIMTSLDEDALMEWAGASRGIYEYSGDPGAYSSVAALCLDAEKSMKSGTLVGPSEDLPIGLVAAALVSLGMALALSAPAGGWGGAFAVRGPVPKKRRDRA